MKRINSFHKVCVILLLCALHVGGHAQPPKVPAANLGFIAMHENVIRNSLTLESFLEKLHHVKVSDSGKVNVIHIGDSHIQADFLTEVVRRNLQLTFGNAGRGLVVPARVAGTNEPFNFRTSSSGTWNAKRIIHTSKPLPIGIGGITLNTETEGSSFSITMKDPEMDYAFNRITLFAKNDSRSFSISILDSLSAELVKYTPSLEDPNRNVVALTLPGRYHHVVVKGIRESNEQTHTTLFGINLENSHNGVLYHAIGVNGARYEHYNKAELFASQTALLNPDLIIISLGTNESVEYPHIKPDFIRQINTLVQALKSNNPNAAIMLATPPDAFLRKVRYNPGIEIIRQQILEYAVENGLAFWDMYRVMGGRNAARRWQEEGLLRPDGIHFTRDGYALQGRLLYEAIMKSYNEYVADRHP